MLEYRKEEMKFLNMFLQSLILQLMYFLFKNVNVCEIIILFWDKCYLYGVAGAITSYKLWSIAELPGPVASF